MHEHIFVLSPEIEANYPYGWDEDARVNQAIDRLNQLKSAGIDSIVDPTVVASVASSLGSNASLSKLS